VEPVVEGGRHLADAAPLHQNRRYLLFEAKTVTLRTVAFPAPSVHVMVMR